MSGRIAACMALPGIVPAVGMFRPASRGTGKDALQVDDLAVSDDAVTIGAWTPESLVKLWQFAPDGSRKVRVSCNRGEQFAPAVTGDRPAPPTS
ncbi:hypothetical protein [Streptomyces sp. NPDC001404]|uniref:hypothetical protein n=1 Tax=Streptomyces sp. NPDC001404 TaxID=3364571 RepID=UPI0036CF75AA